MHLDSTDVGRMAVRMALSETREEERRLKERFRKLGVRAAAIDYGGEFLNCVKTVVERSVVAAKREGVVRDSPIDEGVVAGAAREALSQILPRAFGLNVGGKIGIARYGEHIIVAIFFGVGLLHLNGVAIGLGHRAIPVSEAE